VFSHEPLTQQKGRFAQAPEQPRSFPASGFDLVDESIHVEEEEIPDYLASRFSLFIWAKSSKTAIRL
jgi:hypothetical protein